MSSEQRASSPWLYGPARDLLLGCGLGYALFFPLLLLFGPSARLALPAAVLPLATLVVGAPHYGATLLRVYEQRADRRAYAFFAVHASLLLLAWFIAATRIPWLGSVLVTLYVTWSPWHYSGQNYGIAVLFAKRRQLALDSTTRRSLYLSFLSSFALTALALHSEGGGATYAPGGGRAEAEGTYQILSLGIPLAVATPAFAVAALVYAVTSIRALVGLSRGASVTQLLPVGTLLLTQALWFSVPVVTRFLGVLDRVELFGDDHTAFYFFWAAMGHVVQYLWITSYMARNRLGFESEPRYLWRCLLTGVAIFTVPALLFAPGVLGEIPFGFGLAMLVTAAVNLHHFVLDGAIWKLRDGRLSRLLIKRQPGEAPEAPALPRTHKGRLRPLAACVAALGLGSLAVNAIATYEILAGFDAGLARGDLARVETAVERLRRLGRANPLHHVALADAHAREGDSQKTVRELERALLLWEDPKLLYGYAGTLESLGRNAEALAAYQRVAASTRLAAQDPLRAESQLRISRMWHLQGDRARALEAAERAVRLAPDEPRYRAVVSALQAEARRAPPPGAPVPRDGSP